jgi:outer membrane lipoprotein-sorting protein
MALPGGRRAAIAVAMLIAILALGALLLVIRHAGDSGSITARPGDNPFYLEASVVVLGVAPGSGSRPEESRSSLQWWYQRPGVWRWQLEVEPAEDEPVTILGVADGKDSYLYKSDSNTYTRVSLKDYSTPSLPVSVLLGPIDLPLLIQRWETQDTTVRGGSSGRYLNRDAQVIEYSPTWRATGPSGDSSGGIGRIWIDNESGLIVRNLVDGGSTSQYVDARVTLLELQPKFEPAIFRFDAPSGSRQVQEN